MTGFFENLKFREFREFVMMERKIGEEGNIIDFYIIGDLGKSSLSRCWGVELTVNSVLLFVK